MTVTDQPAEPVDITAWPKHKKLSEREIEILALVAMGKKNEDIGRKLFLSVDTVKTHLRRAFQKLGAHDRARAVVLALAVGILVLSRNGQVRTCYAAQFDAAVGRPA